MFYYPHKKKYLLQKGSQSQAAFLLHGMGICVYHTAKKV